MNYLENPSAFPCPGFADGMTLRDYFAAHAIERAWITENESPTGHIGEPTYAGIAARAYLLADAMLAERAKGATP